VQIGIHHGGAEVKRSPFGKITVWGNSAIVGRPWTRRGLRNPAHRALHGRAHRMRVLPFMATGSVTRP